MPLVAHKILVTALSPNMDFPILDSTIGDLRLDSKLWILTGVLGLVKSFFKSSVALPPISVVDFGI